MPRFFFDFRQAGRVQHDDTGTEFPSAEAAYLGAIDAARELWGQLLGRRQDPRLCAFMIRGQSGDVLFEVPFVELLEACNPGIRPASELRATIRRSHAIHAAAVKTRAELHDALVTTRRGLREAAALIEPPVGDEASEG
jgi:hypothetical protein